MDFLPLVLKMVEMEPGMMKRRTSLALLAKNVFLKTNPSHAIF